MRAVYGFLLLADCIAMTIYLTVALKRLPEKIGNIDPEKNRKGKDWEVFRSNDYFFRLLKSREVSFCFTPFRKSFI